MRAVNSSGSDTSISRGQSSQTAFEPVKVREATSRLAELYCKQLQVVSHHHADLARVEQSRRALLGKRAQVQAAVARLQREIAECENAPREAERVRNEKQTLRNALNEMRTEWTQTKTSLAPLQQQIDQRQGSAQKVDGQIDELEKQHEKLGKLFNMDESAIDCGHVLDKVERFFEKTGKLGTENGQKYKNRLMAGCDRQLSANFGDEIERMLNRHLQRTSGALLACQSVEEFSAAFKGIQADFLGELNARMDARKRLIRGAFDTAHAAVFILASSVFVSTIAQAYFNGKFSQQNVLTEVLQGVFICAAYGLLTVGIEKAASQKIGRWTSFSDTVQRNSNKVYAKTAQQLESQHSAFTGIERNLFRQWRAGNQAAGAQALSGSVQQFLTYLAQHAPAEILGEKRNQVLQTLRLPSMAEASRVSVDLVNQLEQKRIEKAGLESEIRRLRSELTQRKELIGSLEHRLKYGQGKKLKEEIDTLNKKPAPRLLKEVDANRLDEMRAKLAVLEERLSLVEIESQSLEQAHEAKLAELASKVARHQLSDSVILAARQYVCKQLGLHEALFNRMWNRHVGLAPSQLKARFNGEDGTGSLGQPVPGHTTRVGASSYATPELALKALFDVSEVIQNAELAGGVGHTVVQHGVPVGLSAIPPEGEIKTVAATLVEITPASAVERRRLHITPVTVPQDISLTSEVAKQVHQLNT